MHIDIDNGRIKGEEENCHRMAVACDDIGISTAQRPENLLIANRAAIHIAKLMQCIAAIE